MRDRKVSLWFMGFYCFCMAVKTTLIADGIAPVTFTTLLTYFVGLFHSSSSKSGCTSNKCVCDTAEKCVINHSAKSIEGILLGHFNMFMPFASVCWMLIYVYHDLHGAKSKEQWNSSSIAAITSVVRHWCALCVFPSVDTFIYTK